MSGVQALPVAWCRRCVGERPHRYLFARMLACASCGTWRIQP